MTTKTQSIEELKAELAAAKAREVELVHESDALPGKIAEATHEDVRAKARQAHSPEEKLALLVLNQKRTSVLRQREATLSSNGNY